MRSFNEWLTKKQDGDSVDALKTTDGNLGLVTNEDEAMVVNQLEQFVDRVNGILYNVPEEKRGALIQKFIADLTTRCR